MQKFNASIGFDQKFWAADIAGSIAYARASHKSGLLTAEEATQIVDGLGKVRAEWAAGTFDIKPSDEDIHTANERRLTELIGANGGKLHTGRSRNDQVTTDVRLWMREEVWTVQQELLVLIEVMTCHASEHIELLMAGVTHLQPAQPVRYAHWLLSHAAALQRDALRMNDLLPRLNTCPLGCGALAGHAFGLDRTELAASLHFDGVTLNSIDTVCDRDFIAEFLSVSSLLMVHISQLAEDVILLNWRKAVALADAYSTGSSLMPQKKNPDALELLRGKAGRVIGHATGFLCTLKGLPRSYNKDLQEDKEALFDTLDSVHSCLKIASGVVATMVPQKDKLRSELCPEMLATDLAEYLVRKGVPFRETHHVSGAAIKLSEDLGIPVSDLSLEQLTGLHPLFGEDALVVLRDFDASVELKDSIGGTSRRQVVAQVESLNAFITSVRDNPPRFVAASLENSVAAAESPSKKQKKMKCTS